MTKKPTHQDAVNDASDMARITGTQAAKEAIKAMATVRDSEMAAAILANCLEEVRTFANAEASMGAAERLADVMHLALHGECSAELAFKLGEGAAREALEGLTEPGTNYDQAAAFMEKAMVKLIDQIPNKAHAIKGFANCVSLALVIYLKGFRRNLEGQTNASA